MTFVKGHSGNPAGRRPGSRNKVTEFVEGLAGENAEEVTRKLIEQALHGNPVALRACFDRIWPKPRGPKITFALPPIRSGADVPAVLDALIEGLADGAFTTDEFHTMTRAVERMAKTLEVADPEVRLAQANARIALLEAKLEALAEALGGRFDIEEAPRQTPDLAPATDLQATEPAPDRAPDAAFPTRPLASAANLQARTPPPAANGAAPPDPDDAWMRNVLGPDYDAPWPGHADTPPERRHAA